MDTSRLRERNTLQEAAASTASNVTGHPVDRGAPGGNGNTRQIVLWVPDWPVRAAVAAGLAEPGHPIALIARGEVFAASREARREGVRRGLRLREAQSRCPGLVVVNHDDTVDHRAFEPLLAQIEQTVPGVQPVRPGLCALRARGPARFYGGEPAAAARLREVAAEHGAPDACIGIADGMFAAEQAARTAVEPDRTAIVPPGGSAAFVAPFSVGLLGDAAFVTLLQRLGLHTLGDVAALDPLEMEDRFGAHGVRAHALARGAERSVVEPRRVAAVLERSLGFEPGVERVDELAFSFRSTADDFVAGLTAEGLVATAIVITAHAESGACSERTWLHPRWFTAVDVVDRMRWQLSGGESGLDSPIVSLTVSPEAVDAASHHEEGLFGGGPDERVHHALSRVQGMLGHDAVGTPTIGGGRLLADRAVLVSWGDRVEGAVTRAMARPWPGSLPPPWPATVYSPPPRCVVTDRNGEALTVDDAGGITAPPVTFSPAPGRPPRRVTAWAGPWPVTERWWDANAAREVNRLQLVDDDGDAWLVMLEGGQWLLEARYD